MKNTLSGELLVVGWCIVCGCISGVWYDFFKTLRKNGFNSYLMVAIEDVLFWLGETVIIYSALFFANNGVLRWYEFFFTLFGFSIYRWLLSSLFIYLWDKVFALFKVITIPFKKLALGSKNNSWRQFIKRIIKKQR